MKKYLLLLFSVISLNIFSISIDNIDGTFSYNENKEKIKDFTITNTEKQKLKYKIYSDKNNIKISPTAFVLQPNQSKNFRVLIKNNNLDKTYFYLNIEESNIKYKNKNSLSIDKLIRIKQIY